MSGVESSMLKDEFILMNFLASNDPLHGITLEKMLTELVDYFDWRPLSKIIEIRCFYNDPSIKSSLKFLRQTPWARAKVEKLYRTIKKDKDFKVKN